MNNKTYIIGLPQGFFHKCCKVIDLPININSNNAFLSTY